MILEIWSCASEYSCDKTFYCSRNTALIQLLQRQEKIPNQRISSSFLHFSAPPVSVWLMRALQQSSNVLIGSDLWWHHSQLCTNLSHLIIICFEDKFNLKSDYFFCCTFCVLCASELSFEMFPINTSDSLKMSPLSLQDTSKGPV